MTTHLFTATRSLFKVKRRTFNLALHGGGLVPCTGYEFDAGGIMLVVHHELLQVPDRFGPLWSVSDPKTGRDVGRVRTHSRALAIAKAPHYVQNVIGVDSIREVLAYRAGAGKAGT